MESDLEEIRTRVRKVSDLVQEQVGGAVRALFEFDRAGASEVVLGDRQVNRRIQQIDSLCHAFIVRHAPTEEYLRRASAVLRLDVALERIGDYASSIAREVGRLSGPPPKGIAQEVRAIADHARVSLADGLRAFHEGDEGLARSSAGISERDIERTFASVLQVGEDGERSLGDVFGFTHVLNLLMRVTEQSNNIREQTLFALTGEVAERGTFRVLFVDERNDRSSQLAEAYARNNFPGSGEYESAGWSPAPSLNPELAGFLEAKGLALETAGPKAIDFTGGKSDAHHVVVLMEPDERARVEPVPFRTTLVTWDLDRARNEGLDELYGEVARRVDDLMKTLAGPEAA